MHNNNVAIIRHAGRLWSDLVTDLHRSSAARRNQKPPPPMRPVSMVTRNSAAGGPDGYARFARSDADRWQGRTQKLPGPQPNSQLGRELEPARRKIKKCVL